MKTSQLTPGQLRQGDCFLVRVEDAPQGADITPDEGPLVLKHGEATGHRHRFECAADSRLSGIPSGDRYLQVAGATIPLLHEEHRTINVPPGVYSIPEQVEWTDANEPRVVAD